LGRQTAVTTLAVSWFLFSGSVHVRFWRTVSIDPTGTVPPNVITTAGIAPGRGIIIVITHVVIVIVHQIPVADSFSLPGTITDHSFVIWRQETFILVCRYLTVSRAYQPREVSLD
jgi:hypothetical protein